MWALAGARLRAAAAWCRGKPGKGRAFAWEGKAGCSQGQKHSARLRLPAAPDIGTGKVLVAARLVSVARHSAELRCQGLGERKIKELKTGKHWVLSVCFRHRSCCRTSRLPARSSPAQPGEGETQVVIRSCSHPAPRAGALPKAP